MQAIANEALEETKAERAKVAKKRRKKIKATPAPVTRCMECGRHYPRKLLLQGKAAEMPGKPTVIVCGVCVAGRPQRIKAMGLKPPRSKRLAIRAKSCRVYDRKMCR